MSKQTQKLQLADLQVKFDAGQFLDVLCPILVFLRENGDCHSSIYEMASIAFIGALRAANEKTSPDGIEWIGDVASEDLMHLVRQRPDNDVKHEFLHQIASHQSTGERWVIPSVAKELGPILKDVCSRGAPTKNEVLCLIVLREGLNNWFKQSQISKLHLTTFHLFSAADLSLPYSNMFESSVYHRNVEDLSEYVFNRDFLKASLPKLSFSQILLITWLYGDIKPFLQNCLDSIEQKIACIDRDDQPEFSAAKSLFIYVRCHDPGAKIPETLKSDVEFEQLLLTIPRQFENKTSERKIFKKTRSIEAIDSSVYTGAMSIKNFVSSKLALPFFKRKKLKVAVCISGQLRGYKRTFESWEKTFLAGVDYDIFVHSWKEVGGSGAEPFRSVLPFEGENFKKVYRECCLTIGFDEVREKYPTLFKTLKSTGTVTEDSLKNFYGAKAVCLDSDAEEPFSGFSNSQKMHYKIFACNELMDAAEEIYDLVIRIRPDLPIKMAGFDWEDLYNWCYSHPVLFSDHNSGVHYMNYMIGDQIAVARPDIMMCYANTWNIYPELASNKVFACTKDFTGHVSLGMTCWVQGVTVKKIPMKKGGFMDPKAMDSGSILDAISTDSKARDFMWDEKLISQINADCAHSK